MAGIVSYGSYVPRNRVAVSEIARVWGKNATDVTNSLGISQKSVPEADEDAVTIAVTVATRCMSATDQPISNVGALFVGSESHPYAVNPTATITGELLGIGNSYMAADFQFACKAATTAMQTIVGMIDGGMIKAGMAIGSDAAQGKPHDALEYAAAAAGAAILLGEEAHSIARVIATASYTSDTPDFWRRDGIRYPSHAGRFSGEPAYFTHVMGATRRIFDTTGYKPQDFAYCIFHMPNGKFPRDVAKRLGFTKEQLSPSLTVDQIGNPYSASALMGLCAVLDQARPEEKILFVSYGSGAGSDAFVFETKDAIRETQKRRKEGNMTVSDDMNNTKHIDYSSYLRLTHSI